VVLQRSDKKLVGGRGKVDPGLHDFGGLSFMLRNHILKLRMAHENQKSKFVRGENWPIKGIFACIAPQGNTWNPLPAIYISAAAKGIDIHTDLDKLATDEVLGRGMASAKG
jgi:hypothetical protein